MDTVRYVFGCLVVITLPPGVAWWYVIHPFADLWRRVGVHTTISVGMTLLVLSMVPLYWIRDTLLISDLGPSWFTAAIGAVAMAGAAWIAVKRKKYLTLKILIGLPELEEGGKGGTLLTEGPYSVSRNPRYVEMILGIFGYAAFSNYVGAYIVSLITVPAIHLIVIMEEAELRTRFGQEYEEYLARVPRYLPRWASWLRRSPTRS